MLREAPAQVPCPFPEPHVVGGRPREVDHGTCRHDRADRSSRPPGDRAAAAPTPGARRSAAPPRRAPRRPSCAPRPGPRRAGPSRPAGPGRPRSPGRGAPTRPAVTVRTPGYVSMSIASRSATSRASAMCIRVGGRVSSSAMPSRMRCSVLAEMPLTSRSRPSRAAVSRSASVATPSARHRSPAVRGPMPGTLSRVTSDGGTLASSCSW